MSKGRADAFKLDKLLKGLISQRHSSWAAYNSGRLAIAWMTNFV
jgi:hypothetical protein